MPRKLCIRPTSIQSGSANLYVMNGARNWGNSFPAPAVFESSFKIPVQVCPVDDVKVPSCRL